MVMVGVLRQTGGFEYAAIWAAKGGQADLRCGVMVLLVSDHRRVVGAAAQT